MQPQRGHSPSSGSPHWLSKPRRLAQAHTVFREATPASSSAGQWPKAVACSRGDGLCWHSRHQEGTPACDRGCECKLISSRQHIAWLRQRAHCRGRWLWLSRGRFGRGLIKAITSVLLLHFPLILHSELSHTEF